MATKAKSLILIVLGVSLVVVGINMRAAKNSWDETIKTENQIPGTKGRNAAIGAGVGAVGGGVLAAVVGGIGIVVAGTGFGLPAGAALIGTAAALGAGGGAVAGAATGKSATTATHTETITHTAAAYETWQWASVLAIGGVLLLLAILEMRKLKEASKPGEDGSEPIDGEGLGSAGAPPSPSS